MEKIQIEFSKEELEKIKKFKLKNEEFEDTVKRIVLTHSLNIENELWSKNIDEIFDEFEDTFQKLAE